MEALSNDRRISAGPRESTISWTAYYRRVVELAKFVAMIGQATDSTITKIRFLKSDYARLGESIVKEQWVNPFREATQLVIYILQYNNCPMTEN